MIDIEKAKMVIVSLETKLKNLQKEKDKLEADFMSLSYCNKLVGREQGYILYLQKELEKLEELHNTQNETIEYYINRFNKYRHYIEEPKEVVDVL